MSLVQAAESIEALESEHDALLLEALWERYAKVWKGDAIKVCT